MKSKTTSAFRWDDPLLLEDQLTEEERMIRDSARDFAQSVLQPRVIKAFHDESFDENLMREMGAAGLLGATIHGYGCAGVNYVSYGLIMRELERVERALHMLKVNTISITELLSKLNVEINKIEV